MNHQCAQTEEEHPSSRRLLMRPATKLPMIVVSLSQDRSGSVPMSIFEAEKSGRKRCGLLEAGRCCVN